ncbi:MAG: hypothetical protein ACHQM6_08275 [Candidatus Kapaibacterium sp.]
MDKYLEAIKEKVCTHCIDADREGNCRISSAKECTIESNYDRIVKSILAVKSTRYEDYVAGLRENVCENCSYGAPENCDDRNEVECPLDRYYPMIVDAIEDVGIDHIRQAYGAV